MALVISGPETGAAAPTVVFEQGIPATVWGPIAHNYGNRPAAVALFSADYAQQFGEFVIQHLDENTLRIAMETPTSGIALVARP